MWGDEDLRRCDCKPLIHQPVVVVPLCFRALHEERAPPHLAQHALLPPPVYRLL